MKLVFSGQAWEHYLHWQTTDPKKHQRINDMIKQMMPTPFQGVGKPESLKGDFSGWWSRRVTKEDRMVYRVSGKGDAQALELAQMRFHYS